MSNYSPEQKRDIVDTVLNCPNRSMSALIRETGICRATLYRWIKKYRPVSAGFEKRAIKPESWSYSQKLKALLESQHLKDDELGAYLRKHGLFYSNLAQWKAEILDDMKKSKPQNPAATKEAQYLRKIRELEAELKMKERALKEATALINLKKKAELIWPVIEEEKPAENTEKRPSDSSKKRLKKGPE
jgi:transposase